MDRDWVRAEHRGHYFFFYQPVPGVDLRGDVRYPLFCLQHRLHDERHRLLGDGAGVGQAGAGSQPVDVAYRVLRRRGTVFGGNHRSHLHGRFDGHRG